MRYRSWRLVAVVVGIILLHDIALKLRWTSAIRDDNFLQSSAPLSSKSTWAEGQAYSECNIAASCSACLELRCAWCAESMTCINVDSKQGGCIDVETQLTGCSASFLFPIPANHRVIYVGKRSGGPEALIQLHLALLHWNFTSTLETRKRQVGKSLLPYFREMYAKEFVHFGIRMHKNIDYNAFLESGLSSDILILTETWPCKRGIRFDSGFGARQLQYHLTAQDRKHTYDVSHMYITNAHPEECAVVTHTHFMTSTFMNQSSKATLLPYVTPSIISAASTFDGTTQAALSSRTVVLFDGDASFDSSKVSPEIRPFLVKAASIKPSKLLKLFESVLCVIDFGMPGAERLVLEASLFGAIVIISDELNGADRSDFPIPERYRLNGRDYNALNAIISELMRSRNEGMIQRYIDEFEPFRRFVRLQQVRFYRSVRRYFSDSAHFVIRQSSNIVLLITTIFVHVPLATITVVLADDHERELFRSTYKAFLASASTLYLESSISLAIQTETYSIPRQSLLEFHWKQPDCFPISYDYVSIVATAIHKRHSFSTKSPHSTSTEFRCFTVRLHIVDSIIKNSTLSLPQYGVAVAKIDGIAESVADVLAASHLRDDAMWNTLSRHFVV